MYSYVIIISNVNVVLSCAVAFTFSLLSLFLSYFLFCLALVSYLIGSGSIGFANGVGSSALLSSPGGICLDSAGNIVIADTNNHRIRKYTAPGKSYFLEQLFVFMAIIV